MVLSNAVKAWANRRITADAKAYALLMITLEKAIQKSMSRPQRSAHQTSVCEPYSRRSSYAPPPPTFSVL